MNTATLLIIIGVGILVVLIAIIAIAKISNSKKSKNLDEKIKNLHKEKEDIENDNRITLPNDFEEVAVAPQANEELLNQAIVEDYENQVSLEENQYKDNSMNVDFDFKSNKISNRDFATGDDDFDKFMNEHSYSRRIFNKPLLDKIRSLPPDVRMMFLSNILDRHDD